MNGTRLAQVEIPDTVDVQLPRQAVVPVAETAPLTDPEPEPTRVPAQAAAIPDAPEPDRALSPLGLPCDLAITATAMPGAMVALDIMAPCQPETQVDIAHSGLSLVGQTDAFGLLTMDIPGFETPAFFEVALPDGQVDTVLVGLPDLVNYDRVGVQWQGPAELDLHAMEFGASFGEPGHIWSETPGRLDDALAGQNGFLTQLGDPRTPDAPRAQVYTFPHATLRDGDRVRLSIDAQVTETSCGTEVSAHTLEMQRAGPVEITPVSLTMPGCDAVGNYLLLQNLLQDLRLASN